MRHHAFAAALAITAALPVALRAQFTGSKHPDRLPAPVMLDKEGKFQGSFSRVGDDIFIAGQPTEAALREAKALGVTTIVNLRTPPEMARVGFDEAAAAQQLGITYVSLPVRGDAAYPYAPETVTRFAQAVRESKGKVLLHCTVGWRASHLWAAYLIQERHVPEDSALANARAIALADHQMRGMKQPVEEFLGRRLPSLGQENQ